MLQIPIFESAEFLDQRLSRQYKNRKFHIVANGETETTKPLATIFRRGRKK